jgi:hypothetical protein
MRNLAVVTSLLVLLVVQGTAAGSEFETTNVPLSTEVVKVAAEKVLPSGVNQILVGKDYAIFKGNREIWIGYRGKPLKPLSSFATVPRPLNWYQSVCQAGDVLVIGVADYPEEQRRTELATAQGGFRAGPRPMGLLLVKLKPFSMEFVRKFRVTSVPESGQFVGLPPEFAVSYRPGEEIEPDLQSCWWDGKELLIGAYGYQASLDLTNKTARMLEEDGLSFNRPSMLMRKQALWMVMDEGGAGGTSVSVSADNHSASFDVPLATTYALLEHNGTVFAATSAGVAEIDEHKRKIRVYRISMTEDGSAVYALCSYKGELWGVADRGVARLNLDRKTATFVEYDAGLSSEPASVVANVYGDWCVGTADALLVVHGLK